MLCLADRTKLNDSVVNCYMQILQVRGEGNYSFGGMEANMAMPIICPYFSPLQDRDTYMRLNPPIVGPQPPRCHFTHSFFAGKLYFEGNKYNYGKVASWMTPEKLKGYNQVGLRCYIIMAPPHFPRQSLHTPPLAGIRLSAGGGSHHHPNQHRQCTLGHNCA